VAITVVVHAIRLVSLLMALVSKHRLAPTRFWSMTSTAHRGDVGAGRDPRGRDRGLGVVLSAFVEI
jgi:hypothetical protein